MSFRTGPPRETQMSPSALAPPGLAPAVRLAFWRQLIDLIEERLSLFQSAELNEHDEANPSFERVSALREELQMAYEQISLLDSPLDD